MPVTLTDEEAMIIGFYTHYDTMKGMGLEALRMRAMEHLGMGDWDAAALREARLNDYQTRHRFALLFLRRRNPQRYEAHMQDVREKNANDQEMPPPAI